MDTAKKKRGELKSSKVNQPKNPKSRNNKMKNKSRILSEKSSRNSKKKLFTNICISLVDLTKMRFSRVGGVEEEKKVEKTVRAVTVSRKWQKKKRVNDLGLFLFQTKCITSLFADGRV